MNHAAIVTTDGTYFVTEAQFENLADAYEQISKAEMVTGWSLNYKVNPLTEIYEESALVVKNVNIKTIKLVGKPTIQQLPQRMERVKPVPPTQRGVIGAGLMDKIDATIRLREINKDDEFLK